MLTRRVVAVLAYITTVQALVDSWADLFQGQLADLSDQETWNPASGSQDYEMCCMRAVKQSLEIVDGIPQYVEGQSIIQGNISSFLQEQFPCTAQYNGGPGDPRQVIVSYSWCKTYCDGWEETRATPADKWLEPLLAFILPTVVFCFAIPRRHTIVVPDALFPHARILSFPRNLTLFYTVFTTALVLVIDSVAWVITVMIFAGPMMLSGFQETYLDTEILHYLDSESANAATLRERVGLLLIALTGNLDHAEVVEHTEALLNELRPSASQAHRLFTIKTQLAAILNAQPAFGATTGIGVLFYTASYVYSVKEILNNLGNNYTSHALAFGIFWMEVGHVAIVAGMPLSSNNPTPFEGMSIAYRPTGPRAPRFRRRLSTPRKSSVTEKIDAFTERFMWKSFASWPAQLIGYFYRSSTSGYNTAWMWNRGISKWLWLEKTTQAKSGLEDFRSRILHVRLSHWLVSVIFPTICFTVVPAFLGGMVSYMTPTIGLSCRSMVPLLYATSQLLLILLWLLDWQTITSRKIAQSKRQTSPMLHGLWYLGFSVAILTSIVAAIGGTVFQIMGLFKNCLCFLPIQYWADRNNPDVSLTLGLNSYEQVYNAQAYWLPCGLAAMIFLLVAAASCWRYQRNLRQRFLDTLNEMEEEPQWSSRRSSVYTHTASTASTASTTSVEAVDRASLDSSASPFEVHEHFENKNDQPAG